MPENNSWKKLQELAYELKDWLEILRKICSEKIKLNSSKPIWADKTPAQAITIAEGLLKEFEELLDKNGNIDQEYQNIKAEAKRFIKLILLES